MFSWLFRPIFFLRLQINISNNCQRPRFDINSVRQTNSLKKHTILYLHIKHFLNKESDTYSILIFIYLSDFKMKRHGLITKVIQQNFENHFTKSTEIVFFR